jgi:hypothetical protein
MAHFFNDCVECEEINITLPLADISAEDGCGCNFGDEDDEICGSDYDDDRG